MFMSHWKNCWIYCFAARLADGVCVCGTTKIYVRKTRTYLTAQCEWRNNRSHCIIVQSNFELCIRDCLIYKILTLLFKFSSFVWFCVCEKLISDFKGPRGPEEIQLIFLPCYIHVPCNRCQCAYVSAINLLRISIDFNVIWIYFVLTGRIQSQSNQYHSYTNTHTHTRTTGILVNLRKITWKLLND